MEGTALQIVRQAEMELGLPASNELVLSQEATAIQMLGLLNAAGNELVMAFDWEFLTKTHAITTIAGVGAYPAPTDYARMLNQTLWDHDNRRPAYGPVSPQGWQVLTNALISVGPFARYRVARGKTEFLPVPGSDGKEFNYQYISNGWVQDWQNPTVYKAFITNDADVLTFDFWLMVKYLKVKMWQAKGLDTASLITDFTRVFDAQTGQDHGAPVLGLANTFKVPWLTMYNVPDGNWNTGQP
jgi:hypothetical protein